VQWIDKKVPCQKEKRSWKRSAWVNFVSAYPREIHFCCTAADASSGKIGRHGEG
jgi:hypothetical protein